MQSALSLPHKARPQQVSIRPFPSAKPRSNKAGAYKVRNVVRFDHDRAAFFL